MGRKAMGHRFENAFHARFCAACRMLAVSALAVGIAAALGVAGAPLASSPATSHEIQSWIDAPATGYATDYAASTRGAPAVEIILR